MNTFSPQCTLPESTPYFVKQPNVRSTMDIVWGSLSIIFLCTWSILHLNVPPQFRQLPPPKNTRETIRRTFSKGWFSFRRKLFWMTVTILFPELVLGAAFGVLSSAVKCTRKFRKFRRRYGLEGEVDWTLAHSMYANMGGFVLRFPKPNVVTREEPEQSGRRGRRKLQRERDIITLWLDEFRSNNEQGYRMIGPFDWNTHSHNIALAESLIRRRSLDDPLGLNKADPVNIHARLFSGDTWTINGFQMLEARLVGIVGQLPNITDTEIYDKSKSDALLILLAILQVTWLIFQLITRAVNQKQSSQIEITAVAYSACAIITYLLLLYQPKDVQTPTVLTARRCPTEEEFLTLVDRAAVSNYRRTKNDTYNFPAQEDGGPYNALGLLGLTVFGAIHLAAWNMSFPSQIEQVLWRVSAVFCTCLPIPVVCFTGCLQATAVFLRARVATTSHIERISFIISTIKVFGKLVFVLFIIARLYLLVEALRSTYYLSPSSYITTWASR